jgi:hypothetical protein
MLMTMAPTTLLPHPIDIIDPCNNRPEGTFTAVWVAGIAYFFIVFGINYCRYSWETQTSKIMTIVFGLLSMCVGLALLFLSSKYAPELYTAPLLALMIPINFVVARNVNKEIVDNDSFMHGMYICFGCLIASAASAVCPSNDHSVVDVPGIAIWASLSGSSILILACFLLRARLKQSPRSMLQVIGGPTLSASLLANASLSTRAIVLHPDIIMLSLFSAVLAVAGIIILTLALSDTRALTVVPIWVAVFMLLDIMGGAIFFAELHAFSSMRIFFFILAIILIVVAIVLQIAVEDFSTIERAIIPQHDKTLRVDKPLRVDKQDFDQESQGLRQLDQ